MIYLDHNATSPPTNEHLKKIIDIITQESPANPSSPHASGRAASVLLARARKQLAATLDVDVGEIIFTSGGTEANNLGTRGVFEALDKANFSVSIITTEFEHPSILKPLLYLKQTFQECVEIIYLKPDTRGYISIDDIISNIKPNTVLISVMAANNEIGTIQPVKAFGDFLNFMRWKYEPTHAHKLTHYPEFTRYFESLTPTVSQKTLQTLHFHVDAVQTFGKLPAKEWMSAGYDSIALSGHKVGALQGVGALMLRRGRKFIPLTMGGSQEKNRRAGTENLPGILSLGLVCEEMAKQEFWQKIDKTKDLVTFLFNELSKKTNLIINSHLHDSLPNTIHFSLTESAQSGENLIVNLDMNGICVSSGSACSSGVNLPSHVVLALGKNKSLAQNSIRISLGSDTTHDDIKKLLSFI